MLIIDPDRDGCTVWHEDKVCHIKGNVDECILKVVNYMKRHRTLRELKYPYIVGNGTFKVGVRYEFDEDIGIDVSSYGKIFGDCLESEFGIHYIAIKGKHFIDT